MVSTYLAGVILATGWGESLADVGYWWWVVVLGLGAAWLLSGTAGGGSALPTVVAGCRLNSQGQPEVYTLSLGGETIELLPGKAWIQADHFKWSIRGLIEEPQSYHVHANGAVEVNGEKILLSDPEGPAKLQHEINKRHALAPAPRRAPTLAGTQVQPVSDRVRFRVKLDHLGHLCVECHHGGERTETGLRGLAMLIHNGLMLKAQELHVDPLQRSVDLDGHHFECTEAGAHALETLLNERYAPRVQGPDDTVIEVRENPASSTGFDIHFVTFHAGARLEVKGHLGQDKLDILQDPTKCDLLRHGTVLKIAAPHLLIRRKRSDGGEERIPGVEDVAYRRVTAAQLQAALNHPLLRKGAVVPRASASADQLPPKPAEAQPPAPPPPPPQPAPPVEAAPPPRIEPTIEPRASLPRSPTSPGPEMPAEGTPSTPVGTRAEADSLVSASGALEELFRETDACRVNGAVFERLCVCLGVPLQTVYLSLPRVFENRRFDVLAFSHEEVTDLSDIRSSSFYGFYLSHVDAEHLVLVYACEGRHVEWGPHKCLLQPSLTAEAEEYQGAALLGMLQDPDDDFVFVVTPSYKQWVKSREVEYHRVCARFMTADEVVRRADEMAFIWPPRDEGAAGVPASETSGD